MGKAKRLRTAQWQAGLDADGIKRELELKPRLLTTKNLKEGLKEAEAIKKGLEKMKENMEECMDKPIIEALQAVDGKGGGKYKAMLKELKKQGGLSSKVPKPPEGHGLL